MNQTADSTIVAKVAAAMLLIAALYVMAADFFNLRQAHAIQPVAGLDELNWPQPWGGYGWQHLARDAGRHWRLDPVNAEKLIHRAAERYPLDSRQWLDLARIGIAGGATPERVPALLQVAHSVQPEHRETLWAATQIALQVGRHDLAEKYLAKWLKPRPAETERALFVGSRWLDTPEQQIDRLLPESRAHLVQAMAMARRHQDPALADAVWTRLKPKPGLEDRAFLDYIELLLNTGESRRASRLWAAQRPEISSGVFNGGFDHALGESLGLNWRMDGLPSGVRIQRDSERFHLGPASLAIHFDGRENVNLNAPWIRIPVEPGQHYRLTGYWSAEGLTTQALPYLYLYTEGARLQKKAKIPGSSFAWQPWSFEFTAPEQSQIVRLRLKRDPSNAFDRNIAGRLWLDELSLSPALPSGMDSVADND